MQGNRHQKVSAVQKLATGNHHPSGHQPGQIHPVAVFELMHKPARGAVIQHGGSRPIKCRHAGTGRRADGPHAHISLKWHPGNRTKRAGNETQIRPGIRRQRAMLGHAVTRDGAHRRQGKLHHSPDKLPDGSPRRLAKYLKRFAHRHRVSYFNPVTDPNPQTPFDTVLIRQRRNRAAADYGAFDFLKTLVATQIAERLLDSNRSFETGVDIGSHHGQVRAPLIASGRLDRLIHTDSSPDMLRHAQGPRLVMDDERLAFANGSVDFITSALVLHRLNDLPGALIQIRRSLRPDGLFIGAMFGGETLMELRTAFSEAEAEMEGGISPRVAPFADVRDMGGLMQRAGFALPVVDADRHTVTYESPFALLRDLRGMGETNALNDRRKQPLRRATLMRMAEIYAQRYATPEGRVSATFQIVYLAGWAPDDSQQKPLRPGSAKQRLADALNTEEISTGEKPGQ